MKFTVPIEITYKGVYYKEVDIPIDDEDTAEREALESVWDNPPDAGEIDTLDYVDADFSRDRPTERG